jgi:hypothetical protein
MIKVYSSKPDIGDIQSNAHSRITSSFGCTICLSTVFNVSSFVSKVCM